MKHLLLSIILTISLFSMQAQSYRKKAELYKIEKSGFYKIPLIPRISSDLQYNFPDVRIYDKDNQEIPFIYGYYKNAVNYSDTLSLKIIKNHHKKIKQFTEVIIENDSGCYIGNFMFRISNINNRVPIKISASNDKKHWYLLKNFYTAQSDYTEEAKTYLHITNIPKTNFKYFQFLFHDYDNKTNKIYNAYFFKDNDSLKKYTALKMPKITHKDTLNKTIVTIEQEKSYYIDKIKFSIDGPKYFFRKAELTKKIEHDLQKNGQLYYDDIKKDIRLGSDHDNIVYLSGYKAKTLILTIDNKDNNPIRIRRAKIYQKNNFLIAYLQKGQQYFLKYDSPVAKFPVYDLSYFKDKIPKNLPTVKVRPNKEIGANHKTQKIWDFPTYYLWIAISAVGSILIFLTARIITERYKNKL